jgi:hypothetical protein
MKVACQNLATMAAAIGIEIAMRGATPAGAIGASAAFIGGYYLLDVEGISFRKNGWWNRDLAKLIATSLSVQLLWNAFARLVISQLSAWQILGLSSLATAYFPSTERVSMDNIVDLTAFLGGEIAIFMFSRTIRSSAEVVTMGTGLYGLAVTIILGTALTYSRKQTA